MNEGCTRGSTKKAGATSRRWWAVGLMATLAVVVVVAGIAVTGSTPRIPVVVAMTSPTVGVQARTGLPAPTSLVEAVPDDIPSSEPHDCLDRAVQLRALWVRDPFPAGIEIKPGGWHCHVGHDPDDRSLNIFAAINEPTAKGRDDPGRDGRGDLPAAESGGLVPRRGRNSGALASRLPKTDSAMRRLTNDLRSCGPMRLRDAVLALGAGDDVLVIILRSGRRQPTDEEGMLELLG